LEAQRLGLDAYASDLNPVPVLINKALIEIPAMFFGRSPVSLTALKAKKDLGLQRDWAGATGLAEDVRHYGAWIREEAKKRIGHLYPPVEITAEMAKERPDLKPLVGQELNVIAWIWARTVKSPNPAFSHVDVPLASTFVLSSKEEQEAYVQPKVDGAKYQFFVRLGTPSPEAKQGTSAGKRAAFKCLISGAPIDYEHIRTEGKAGRLGQKLMAIIAEGDRGRVYLSPGDKQEAIAAAARPTWRPEAEMPKKHRNFQPPAYGMEKFGDLFTDRQLEALTTLSDLVGEVRNQIREDALSGGDIDDGKRLEEGGTGVTAYAEAVSVYLAFAVDKVAEGSTTICTWSSLPTKFHVVSTFGRQAIPMTWDFAESNIFANSSGNFLRMCELIANVIERQCGSTAQVGHAEQMNASQMDSHRPVIFSTDPPYYDNIAYADLSDFFYPWIRRALKSVFPHLATITVPKAEELVALAHRHGSKEKAEAFFLKGMTDVMHRLKERAHPSIPVTIYYAFKQSDTEDEAEPHPRDGKPS
jgi:putative DNA methylase